MTKKLISIALSLLFLICISVKQSSAQSDTAEPTYEEVFKVVEQMPEFPGCEDISSKEERKLCSNNAMVTYLYENLIYPEEAIVNKTEGTCVLQFIVNTSGVITNIKIVRGLKDGCSSAAIDVIESMNENNIKWSPGSHNGEKVNVQKTLPIKFKLKQ